MIDRADIEKRARLAIGEALRRRSWRPVAVQVQVSIREPRPDDHFDFGVKQRQGWTGWRRKVDHVTVRTVKPSHVAEQPPLEVHQDAEAILAIVGDLVDPEQIQIVSTRTSIDWAVGRDREIRIDFERVA